MSEVGRPSQKLQPSRKGKKAWRKNIDIDDIQELLELKRAEIRELGETVDELPSDKLFQIDVQGESKNLQKHKVKKLKADEILANKSKVKPLEHAKRSKKFQGVSSKEVNRLMKIAGRVQGENSSKEAAVKQTVSHEVTENLWGEAKKQKGKEIPSFLKEKSSTSVTVATVVPKTLKEQPIKVKEMEKVPHAGKSYNPSDVSWRDLIKLEYFKEKKLDDKKIELKKFQEGIQDLIKAIEEDEEKSDGDDDEEEDEENEKEAGDARLSVNKVVTNKKKTRAQRNKKKRHDDKLKLQEDLKELKKKVREIEQLSVIEKSLDDKAEAEAAKQPKKRKSAKLGSKYHAMDEPLEVKLSDELNDSLRKLRPEGNLLYDQMRTLQSKGKVESRLPVKKKRRYAPKLTEKWTYKDFK